MKIIYEDSQIIVCYKESGLPVQSARIGTKDLVSILKGYLWEQGGKKKEPYLGVIHRLDQPVEGILVFAKNSQAAGQLSEQVKDGRMKKIYRAVARRTGKNIPQEGRLTDYLVKDGKTNTSRVVLEGTEGAKAAELEYRILQERKQTEYPEITNAVLMEIQLLTGRHHQIRVQMANAGMPLLGDRKYGETEGEISSGINLQNAPLGLCAVSLSLFHPKTGKKMEFSCEPEGEYFQLFGTY